MMPSGTPPDPSLAATDNGDRRRSEMVRLGAWGRLRAILEGAPPQPVELFNTLHLVSWGVWLFAFPSVFARDPVLYRSINFADEVGWGWLSLSLGAFGLSALLLDGRGMRAIAAQLTFSFWLFLALLLGAPTGFSTTEVPIYLVRALSAGWVYIRLERGRRRLH
jgi:hypothetical protein